MLHTYSLLRACFIFVFLVGNEIPDHHFGRLRNIYSNAGFKTCTTFYLNTDIGAITHGITFETRDDSILS